MPGVHDKPVDYQTKKGKNMNNKDKNTSYEMKTYIGTKTVRAKRMAAADAKQAGANVHGKYFEVGHAEYNPGADGYLVIYDGGYRSWSPAKVFEESYNVAETHVDRMKIELADLNERICKAIRATYTFGALPDEQRWELKKQLEAMQVYADVLYGRIRDAVEPRSAVISAPYCCSAATTKEGK